MTEPILEVKDLCTYFYTDEGIVRAVDGVSFCVYPGQTLGIVGESGSGKSVTAMSIVKLLEEPSRIVDGQILFRGRNIVTMNGDEVRRLRGASIAMVFQDPMTSLNPVLRIAKQLIEAMLVHGQHTAKSALKRAVDLLGRMGITSPERAVTNFPHQFSGGMRQRVMLAMGFGNDPSLLIADEPTTALDVTIQAQILDLLRELNADFGTAIILISHDLGVVANVCSRVVVMYAGEVVEEGPTEDLLSNPMHPYTWALINAVPRVDRAERKHKRLTVIEGAPPDAINPPSGCRFADRCPFRISKCDEHPTAIEVAPGRRAACWVTQSGTTLPKIDSENETPAFTSAVENDQIEHAAIASNKTRYWQAAGDHAASSTPERELNRIGDPSRTPVIQLKRVVKYFPLKGGNWIGKTENVHAVDGIDLAVLAGETVGLVGESGCGKSTVARLITRLYRPTSGEIWFEGQEIGPMSNAELRPIRRHIQMMFQDPYASLNPRMTVGSIIGEPLRVHDITHDQAETKERVQELLALVGLSPRSADQYPHEFSGGQRQRIGIARTLAVEPRFIVADEPISSLDVNIQAQILNLLVELQEQLDLTYVFISHNLSVVRHISDRIVVLYLGKVTEVASNLDLFDHPLHPYTKCLISAVPVPDAHVECERRRIPLTGETPSPVHPPSGCRFRTRCPIARPVCTEEEPPLIEHGRGQWAACHFPGEL